MMKKREEHEKAQNAMGDELELRIDPENGGYAYRCHMARSPCRTTVVQDRARSTTIVQVPASCLRLWGGLMIDRWIDTLSPKQLLLTFLAAVLVLLQGMLVSIIVLLAQFSVWQAALAGLACISAFFLYCIVRLVVGVVRVLRS